MDAIADINEPPLQVAVGASVDKGFGEGRGGPGNNNRSSGRGVRNPHGFDQRNGLLLIPGLFSSMFITFVPRQEAGEEDDQKDNENNHAHKSKGAVIDGFVSGLTGSLALTFLDVLRCRV